MLSRCVYYWSAYARQQCYNLSPPGDTAWRKMVWHYYANVSLITLWASTIFSLKTNSKANHFEKTLYFFITTSVLVYSEISQAGTHSFGRFWLLIQDSSSKLTFFLPVVHCFVSPLLTTEISVIFPAMKNADESQNSLQEYCLMSSSVWRERPPYSLQPEESSDRVV